MSRFYTFVFLVILFQPYAYADKPAAAEARTQLFGRDLSVTQSTDANADNQGVTSHTKIQFLGQPKDLSTASVEALAVPNANASSKSDSSGSGTATPSTGGASSPDGSVLGNTNWYIGGIRIWSGQLTYKNGSLAYKGEVAPTEIPFPLLTYPLGPVLLKVDAGISFQGNLDAQLTPVFSIPFENTFLFGTLQAGLSAAAFIDAYAQVLFIRAGIEGQLNVIDGKTGVKTMIRFDKSKPTLEGFGKVVLLNGSIFGHVDTKLLFGTWKRIYRKDFFDWPGKCFSFGAASCGY